MQPHTEFQWERDPCRFLGQQRFGERVKLGQDSAPWCWEVGVWCWAFSEQLYNLPEELDPPLCEGSALLHCHPGQVTIWVTFFYLCLQFQLDARCSLSCFTLLLAGLLCSGRCFLDVTWNNLERATPTTVERWPRAVINHLLPRRVLLFSEWAQSK